MLTVTRAVEIAARHQRGALIEANAHAARLGEPVGFLRRAGTGGAVFEAVALDSARTCAVVDERGGVRFIAGPRAGEAFRRPTPDRRFRAGVARAEAALVAAARPRGDEAA